MRSAAFSVRITRWRSEPSISSREEGLIFSVVAGFGPQAASDRAATTININKNKFIRFILNLLFIIKNLGWITKNRPYQRFGSISALACYLCLPQGEDRRPRTGIIFQG